MHNKKVSFFLLGLLLLANTSCNIFDSEISELAESIKTGSIILPEDLFKNFFLGGLTQLNSVQFEIDYGKKALSDSEEMFLKCVVGAVFAQISGKTQDKKKFLDLLPAVIMRSCHRSFLSYKKQQSQQGGIASWFGQGSKEKMSFKDILKIKIAFLAKKIVTQFDIKTPKSRNDFGKLLQILYVYATSLASSSVQDEGLGDVDKVKSVYESFDKQSSKISLEEVLIDIKKLKVSVGNSTTQVNNDFGAQAGPEDSSGSTGKPAAGMDWSSWLKKDLPKLLAGQIAVAGLWALWAQIKKYMSNPSKENQQAMQQAATEAGIDPANLPAQQELVKRRSALELLRRFAGIAYRSKTGGLDQDVGNYDLLVQAGRIYSEIKAFGPNAAAGLMKAAEIFSRFLENEVTDLTQVRQVFLSARKPFSRSTQDLLVFDHIINNLQGIVNRRKQFLAASTQPST